MLVNRRSLRVPWAFKDNGSIPCWNLPLAYTVSSQRPLPQSSGAGSVDLRRGKLPHFEHETMQETCSTKGSVAVHKNYKSTGSDVVPLSS